MPIFYKNDNIPSASIQIWKIEEDASFFIQSMPWHRKQLDWLDSIHPLKKLEYLASRYLIFLITGKLNSHLFKDEAGKLHLDDSNQNLSISHSGEWVGLALSKRQVGFDLQKFTQKIKTISRRFLSEIEYSRLKRLEDDQLLIVAWTIKEAVYKAYGKNGILFSKQIFLDLSEFNNSKQNISFATLKLEHQVKTYEIHHAWMENFGWAIALEM